jgi:uncharacterized membrane protein
MGCHVKLRADSFATRFSLGLILISALVVGVLVPGAVAQANIKGQWSTLPYTVPINPIHVALLYNGKVLIVSGSGNLDNNNNYQAGVWDPQAGTITTQPVTWDMFCNGMVALPDGRILINGGTLHYNPFLGLAKTSIYDPASNAFTDVQNTAHGRWYPTLTTLADGRVMTFSGLNETDGATNNAVEIYTVGSGWSQEYLAPWSPPLYPRMHLLPNGKVFYSGWTPTSRLFDPSTKTWTTIAGTNYGGNRTYGSSVMLSLTPENNYDPKVLILGGGNPSTTTTEIIDLGAPSPTWQWGPDMSQPRIEMDAVLLPSGKVLALGGSYNDEDASTASLNADLYDPATNTFSSAGANAYARLYHTVALLLPDATVWLAGGNPNNTYEKHMEIYQPAYLFTTDINGNPIPAQRPTISSSPATTTWGGSFSVQTPDAADISSVVLVRNGSSTHAFDMDTRLVGLAFTKGGGTLTVTGPPNANIAPPGYYMLFILNSSGVPSVAKFIQVGQANDFSVSATPTSNTVLQGFSTTYDVSVIPFGGFSGAVNLSVSGLPQGVTGTFNPDTLQGSGTSTLTIDASNSASLGTYVLTITATSGSLSHTATVTLNVNTVSSGPFAVDAAVSGDNPSASLSVTTPAFSTSLPNELLLAFISCDSPPSGGMTVNTVTGAGLTWELVKRANGQPGDAEIWRAFATAPLSNVTVTAGLAQSVASSITVISFTGVDSSGTNGSGAIGATGAVSAPSGAPSASLITTRNGSWVFGVGTDWDRAVGRTVGANQTILHQYLPPVGSTYWVQAQNSVTPLSGTVVTINDTAPTTDKYDLSIVEILPGVGSNPDFSVSAIPSSQSVQAGASTQYTVTITGQDGFSGTVNFSVSGLPAGATGAFNPVTVTGSGSSTLTINTSGSTPLGSYPLTVTATSGSLTHPSNVTLVVTGPADFAISASPASQAVQAGSSTQYTVAIVAQNGFAGTVVFSVSGLPAGATGSFNPTTITGSGFTTLTIATLTSTAAGTYPITISGSSQGLNHNANVTLIVTDFSLSATPASQSVQAGSSTSYTATIAAQNGFSGTVNLSVSGLPAGATGTFNPVTVTGPGSSTLTVNTLGSTPLGSYPLTVTGTSGSLSHSTGVTLVVTAPPPPSPLAIDTVISQDATSASSSITTAAFSTTQPNEVLLAFISADSSPSGGMTVNSVTGGGLTWVLVRRTNGQPGDAEIWRGFATSTLSNVAVTANLSQSAVSSITVVTFTGADASGTNGSGAIGATGGASAASGAPTASLVTTRNNSWVFGVGADWDHAIARALGANQTMVHQYLTPVSSTYWVQRQNSVTPLSGTAVTINDTAPTTDRYDLSIVEILPAVGTNPDFSLTATPASQTVQAGSSTSYTATITAQNGFSDTVNLSVSGLPVGATGTFNPVTVSGSGSSTLTIDTLSSTPAGSYTLTITGTSGSLSHTATVTLVVTDFSLSATPASQTVQVGSSTSYTATITAQNGFSGTVSLSVSGLPAGATGTFNPVTVSGSGPSTLTVTTLSSTPVGSYTLTITGTSGSLSHTTTVTLVVTDFSISATPASQTVQAGSVTSYTATVTAQNGFSGTVSLSVSGLPAGATGTFNPVTVTGSGSSTLTINTLTSTPVGNYTLTITGTSGSLSHSTSVTFVVTPPPLAIDNVAWGDATSGSVSITTSAFSTAAPNELLLAFISADGPPSGGMTVTSVTGAGLTWVLVKRTNGQPGDAEIWRTFAPSVLSNVTVTANLSRSTASSITVVTFTGADRSGTNGSGAIGATGGASAPSGAPTASLVTTRNNSWVFGVGTDWDRAVHRTVGANQSLVHEYLAPVKSTYWVQRQNAVTPLSGTIVTINDTAPANDKYDLSIVEILQAP